MGARTHDIFGAAAGAQPATRGSYGEAPAHHRLPETTRLGPVRLQVSDIERSLRFYEGTLGLRVLEREESRAELAAHGDGAVLVELREHRGASAVPRRGRLGLFHFAILLPDRPSLGRFVRHLAVIGAPAGSADHLVSEAFYLQDPDNLGIEVYADRPRSAWRRVGRQLMMATDPVDVAALVQEAGHTQWTGMPSRTVIGHVHLHVGDLTRATAFYSQALGFDRMVWHYPGALFFGAGGYHHHLGTNTWAGTGASQPQAGDARLLEWTIELPDDASVGAAAASLTTAGFAAEPDATAHRPAFVTRDPWETQIRVRAAGPRDGSREDRAALTSGSTVTGAT